jgi:hypothetical protein
LPAAFKRQLTAGSGAGPQIAGGHVVVVVTVVGVVVVVVEDPGTEQVAGAVTVQMQPLAVQPAVAVVGWQKAEVTTAPEVRVESVPLERHPTPSL